MKLRQPAKRNRGFSLVEVIIVVAILAACGALISTSIAVIPAREARKCVNEMDAALSRCKIECMAKHGNASLTLTCKSDGYYLKQQAGGIETEEKIANRRCSVKCGAAQMAEGSAQVFSFDYNTGAFDQGKNVGTVSASGGGRTYTITLYAKTGAHEIGGA